MSTTVDAPVVSDTPAPEPNTGPRVLAGIGGGLVLLIGGIFSVGSVLVAAVAAWLGAIIVRGRGHRVTRLSTWISAVAGAAFAAIVGGMLIWRAMPEGAMETIRHVADSAMAEERAKRAAQGDTLVAISPAMEEAANRIGGTVGAVIGVYIVGAIFALLFGSIGWGGVMLLVYAFTGGWLTSPSKSPTGDPVKASLVLLALAASLLPSSAVAQDTPEAAAKVYAEALKRSDYAAAARLTHPDALKQLREMFAPMMSSPELAGQVGPMFFGVRTRADYDKMADSTIFTTFLGNVMAQQAGLGEMMKTATVEVLGHVKGGADTVFVVARVGVTVEGTTITQYDVQPFARHQGQWRGLLKADLTNMAAMMQQQLGRRP